VIKAILRITERNKDNGRRKWKNASIENNEGRHVKKMKRNNGEIKGKRHKNI
jgi:hypothetical protein